MSIADFQLDGGICHRGFIRPDNEQFYPIDRIIDVRRDASLSVRGTGMMYLCRGCGKEVKFFNEDGKWFFGKTGNMIFNE